MNCRPCQKRRIQNLIAKLKQLHAVEHYKKADTLYIKTFLIDDTRNNNGWRASWDSIKKNANSFVGKPGIEYEKCGKYGCMLDHTDGDNYDDNIHIQEKYRVTTIVDTVLDEDTHTAYAIHMVNNAEFAKKIEREEIRFLSPAIWPNSEQTTMYLNDDQWYIDTTDWKGLHDAFVDSPAYGHRAKIVGQCTGDEDCVVQLKQDKMMLAARAILTAAKLRLYSDRVFQASKFRPSQGETPDSDGNYWRKIRGRSMPFSEGEEMADKIDDAEKFKDKDKSDEKPTDGEVRNVGPLKLDNKRIDKIREKYSKIKEIHKEGRKLTSPPVTKEMGNEYVQTDNMWDKYIEALKNENYKVSDRIYFESIKKHGKGDAFVAFAEEVTAYNDELRERGEKAEEFFRFSNLDELDSYLEENPSFGESSFSVSADAGYKCLTVEMQNRHLKKFSKIIITYPANEINKGAKTAIYTPFIRQSYNYAHQTIDTEKSVSNADETETRIPKDTKVPVGKLKISFYKIMDTKTRDELMSKYKELGELEFSKVRQEGSKNASLDTDKRKADAEEDHGISVIRGMLEHYGPLREGEILSNIADWHYGMVPEDALKKAIEAGVIVKSDALDFEQVWKLNTKKQLHSF